MSRRKSAEAAEAIEPAADQPAEINTPAPTAGAESENAPPEKEYDPVRSWRQRYVGPVRYQTLTDSRIHKIIIKFKLPEGQRTPSDEVLAIMGAAKVNGDGSPTGLRFEDSRTHGKAWMIPNDTEGRALAGRIEGELEKIGAQPAPAAQQGV